MKPTSRAPFPLLGEGLGWGLIFLRNLEGLQDIRTLGRNMARMLKCIELGKQNGIEHPALEERIYTSFIN